MYFVSFSKIVWYQYYKTQNTLKLHINDFSVISLTACLEIINIPMYVLNAVD